MIGKMIVFACAVMLACLAVLLLNANYLSALARHDGIGHLSLRPWANRAVGIPLIVFLLAVTSFIIWAKQPASLLRRLLLLIVLVIDLGSFGWFFEWRYASLDSAALAAPATAARYKNLLAANSERLLSYRTSDTLTE